MRCATTTDEPFRWAKDVPKGELPYLVYAIPGNCGDGSFEKASKSKDASIVGPLPAGFDHWHGLVGGGAAAPGGAAATTADGGAGAAVVEMTDRLTFEPEQVEVAVGEEVTWKNVGKIAHTITAERSKAADPSLVSVPAGASEWDSGFVTEGESLWPRARTLRSAPEKLHRMVQPSVQEERVLIERARSGDRLAFEELVRRHADRLYAVVLRFLGERREAEDVTQEAFLRAWRSIGGFKGRSRFYTWLYRIGLNEAKRRVARRPPPGKLTALDGEPRAEVPDWSEAPETRAAEGELRDVLERAVGALGPDYREPLILRDVEGLSTSEAAEVMGLGEAAFKSRLHRARLAVRESIDQYLGDDR